MSTTPRPQAQTPNSRGFTNGCPSLPPVPKPIIPSKRSEDDDIQFISSNPVKRQRMSQNGQHSHPNQDPGVWQHNIPSVPMTQTLPLSAMPPVEIRDNDRRISTGMVGLPSDFHALELSCALRGVSLPVLEKFALNQPLRKPRPLSPPELSPKQLPCTIAPAMLSINTGHSSPGVSSTQTAPVACMTPSEGSPEPKTPTHVLSTPSSVIDKPPVLNASVKHANTECPPLPSSLKNAASKPSAMPPPPIPRPELLAASRTTTKADFTPSKAVPHDTARTGTAKHPCQVCTRIRHQANIAKTQGLSMLHHNMPHHMIPQMTCHQPYGQQFPPQVMAMGPNSMHPLSSGFSPMMMPLNSSNFLAYPSPTPSPVHSPVHVSQQSKETTNSPKAPEKPDDQPRPSSPPIAEANGPPTTSNSVKPPATLIQPTYRKTSPNLIVDVAETCQERFPFEEVAKRHNVPVEKVFDVFAAIIQVPLLRCPTDRRRAGRLATTRVKEYTRAKKAILDTSSQNISDPKEEMVVTPAEIANHMGQVDFPDGFNPGG
ncbi:uncharacterized protein GGS25DRAFT_333553 [Hypoxylon fragiforme]|uniref:uncharacterized protein n=1 Tax=Hypoxylon fragiforme TaxID=63214 RepID=UPI0020C6DAD0|nr:uncharacterized protein GGS25DRAFT_333553 [Hypoxylon fragiforme]KAI2607431.1 hypothetical protein GGS25DRAFT_333553 [Hypoxylon fragiforme]